jgi:hypothetical protein
MKLALTDDLREWAHQRAVKTERATTEAVAKFGKVNEIAGLLLDAKKRLQSAEPKAMRDARAAEIVAGATVQIEYLGAAFDEANAEMVEGHGLLRFESYDKNKPLWTAVRDFLYERVSGEIQAGMVRHFPDRQERLAITNRFLAASPSYRQAGQMALRQVPNRDAGVLALITWALSETTALYDLEKGKVPVEIPFAPEKATKAA